MEGTSAEIVPNKDTGPESVQIRQPDPEENPPDVEIVDSKGTGPEVARTPSVIVRPAERMDIGPRPVGPQED